MGHTLIVIVWAVAAGYVTAGLLSSFYQLVMSEPLTFRMLQSDRMQAAVLAVPLLALSGPALVARNAWGGRLIEDGAWGWVALAVGIVGGWSFVTGIIVLQALLPVVQSI